MVKEPRVDPAVKYAISFVVPEPPSFPLNVLQSVELSLPVLVADAVGRLNVCVVPAELIAKSVPVVPVARVCVAPVSPPSDVIAEVKYVLLS